MQGDRSKGKKDTVDRNISKSASVVANLNTLCPAGIGGRRLLPNPSPGTWPHFFHQAWEDKTDRLQWEAGLYMASGVVSVQGLDCRPLLAK